FFSTSRTPSRSTLFPYTTLFRSERDFSSAFDQGKVMENAIYWIVAWAITALVTAMAAGILASIKNRDYSFWAAWTFLLPPMLVRSEEHTSELQSRENLVCRLLLE